LDLWIGLEEFPELAEIRWRNTLQSLFFEAFCQLVDEFFAVQVGSTGGSVFKLNKIPAKQPVANYQCRIDSAR